MKFYYSTNEVWWNRGVEIKPTKDAFLKFVFQPATNFNISWVDELHISVIVPNNNEAKLIKIEDDNDYPRVKYYYLMDIINKTAVNKHCIFQLDIYLTYILQNTTGNLRTIRTLNGETVNKNINIDPVGVPTGNIDYKILNEDYNIDDDLIFEGKNDKPLTTVPGLHTNIYYVFKTKPVIQPVYWDKRPKVDELYRKKECDYVLIPLLSIDGFNIKKKYKYYIQTRDDEGGSPERWDTKPRELILPVVNTYDRILHIVNNWTIYGQHNGVGEFIGIWVGPNYFRIVSNQSRIISYPFRLHAGGRANWGHLYITNDILIGDAPGSANKNPTEAILAIKLDANGVKINKFREFSYKDMIKNFNYMENENNNVLKNMERLFFNGLFSYSNGQSSIDIDIQLPSTNDNYYNLLNQQKATRNTSIATAGFKAILSAGAAAAGLISLQPTETITTFSSFKKGGGYTREFSQSKFRDYFKPGTVDYVDVDRVYGTSANEKRDVLLNINKQYKYNKDIKRVLKSGNTIKDRRINQDTIGGRTTKTLSKKVGPNIGGWVGAGLGIANAGLQFISTLAQQEAYKRDLRTSLSNSYNNVNNLYTNWMYIANKITDVEKNNIKREYDNINSKDDYYRFFTKEIIYGATTEVGNLNKFYGYSDIPRLITPSEYLSNEIYIQIDELTKLQLELTLSNKFSPTIKDAIITLLSNGIRTSSGPEMFPRLMELEDETNKSKSKKLKK